MATEFDTLTLEQLYFGIKRRRAVDNIPPSGSASYFLVDYHSAGDPFLMALGIKRLSENIEAARLSIIRARETQSGRHIPAWVGAHDWRGRIYGAREFIAAAEVYRAMLRGLLADIEQ